MSESVINTKTRERNEETIMGFVRRTEPDKYINSKVSGWL